MDVLRCIAYLKDIPRLVKGCFMLIRDKVPPRFRSHFCFVSRSFSLEGSFCYVEITFPAISRKRHPYYFVVGSVVPSRIGARCVPLYRKFSCAVFFLLPGVCSCGGGVPGERGERVVCLIGE